jgi:DNA-binding transcriptional MerR regulator
VRIGALSQASGVSVPTIKFYVREHLLPAGRPTASPNQVEYDESHLRRLILLRALIEVGGLSLATTRNAVKRLEFRTATPRDVLLALLVAPESGKADNGGEPEERTGAQKAVNRLMRDRGWQDAATSAPASDLVRAVTALRRLGHEVSDTRLGLYADAAEKLTKRELAADSPQASEGSAAESALVEAVVLGSVLTSMRQLAHLRASDDPPARERKTEEKSGKKRAKSK